MTVDDPFKPATFGSGVFYRDPRAALIWLEAAFGFEPSMVVGDADGKLVHAEMRFGDGYIIVRHPETEVVTAAMKTITETIQISYA